MFGNTSTLDLSSEFKIEQIQDSRDSVVRRLCSYAGAEESDEVLELGDTGDEASDGEYPCLPSRVEDTNLVCSDAGYEVIITTDIICASVMSWTPRHGVI
jgi:hypothetical protein